MSSSQSNKALLSEFTTLAPQITIYRPTPSSLPQAASSNGPSLIILSLWFKALPRNISKYTAAYKRLYPHATILLLHSGVPTMVFRSPSEHQTNLRPCLPVIQEFVQPVDQGDESKKGGILLHLFSNAGAYTASQLARAYKAHIFKPLPLEALFLDSSPGRANFHIIKTGFIAGLPSTPVVKQLSTVAVYGLVSGLTIKSTLSRDENWGEKFRRDLNDDSLFIFGGRGRCYFYGKKDPIVDWTDVELHAQEARKKGRKVRLEMWEETGHVVHVAADPARYWRAIEETWDGGPIKSKL